MGDKTNGQCSDFGSDSNRQAVRHKQTAGDYVLPEGELTMSHTFQKSSLNRGSKGLVGCRMMPDLKQTNYLRVMVIERLAKWRAHAGSIQHQDLQP